MYALRRRKLGHNELMRSELGESLDHLKQAAAHAAGGLGDTVGPRVAAVKVYVRPTNIRDAATHGWDSTMAAFAPLAAAARDGALKAQKSQAAEMKKLKKKFKKETSMSRKRWPMLVGLIIAGAAVGAAGAAVARRRRRQQWDEYDADRALGAVDASRASFDRAVDKAVAGVDKAADATSRGAQKAADKVSSAMSGTKERADSAADSTKRSADDAADDLVSRAGTPSKNNRS